MLPLRLRGVNRVTRLAGQSQVNLSLMLSDCNAKSAGQNEGDSGIYENTDILMRTDDSAPGGEKIVHFAHFFP